MAVPEGRLAAFAAALASGLVGAAAAALFAPRYEIVASAFLAGVMGAVAFEDIRSMRVPDAWNLPAALGGLVAVAWEAAPMGLAPLSEVAHALISAIVCGGVFFLVREFFFRVRKHEGLGFGDVKLAATGGIWVGWEIFPAVVTLAALVAILWIIVAALLRGWSRQRKIPFAAFLAPAIWLCWLYSRTLLA